jgi:hypothetical protein
MGWRGRGRGGGWTGPWPGRGPFSYLPPWQRPGWLYGRGACWWLFAPYLQTTTPQTAAVTAPAYTAFPKEQEITMLENQTQWLEQTLGQIRKRLEELKSGEKE